MAAHFADQIVLAWSGAPGIDADFIT